MLSVGATLLKEIQPQLDEAKGPILVGVGGGLLLLIIALFISSRDGSLTAKRQMRRTGWILLVPGIVTACLGIYWW